MLSAVQDKQRVKNIIKDQAELLEKPSVDLFGRVFRDYVKETAKVKKECKEIYRRERPDQNKRAPHFQNKMGGDWQHLQKCLITNVKVVAVKGIKTEGFRVIKYNKKATFFNKNFRQLKKHNKEEIYIKETVPLPLSGGSLPEIVALHQLTDTHPMVRNLFPNVKVGNFSLAGRLQ